MSGFEDKGGVSNVWDLSRGDDFHGDEGVLDAAEHREDIDSYRQRHVDAKVEKLLHERLQGTDLMARSGHFIGVEVARHEDGETVAKIEVIEDIHDGLFVSTVEEDGTIIEYEQVLGDDAAEKSVAWVAKQLNLPDAPKPKVELGSPAL